MPTLLGQLPPEIADRLDPINRVFSDQMVFRDPPDHTRLRALVTGPFTSRGVDRIHSRIQGIVDELLDAVEGRGEMELINDFAYHFPAIVIAEMLGVPTADRDLFKKWASDVVEFLSPDAGEKELQQGQDSVLELSAWLQEQIARRRRAPGEDLLSGLVEAEEQGEKLAESEVVGMCISLLTAGHESTTSLIGNGTLSLLQNPGEKQKLQANPSLIASAVEEMLRFESPVQRNWRAPTRDVELGGIRLRKRDSVLTMLGAANRDPEQFTLPDRFDIERQNNKHLGFGYGIHFCLGAPLARVEGQVAINTLLHRFPNLRLSERKPKWQKNMMIRGLKELVVAF